tara:strand:- start:3477 stop:3614 length:138 start_codon:yes stop_codon:yes gene_type:complete
MTAEQIAITAIIIGAGSEILALLPIRSNSWVQLLMSALRTAFPKR